MSPEIVTSLLPCHIVREGSHFLEKVGTVSPLHILHHHTKMFPALEAAIHGHHEWIVCEGENVSLSKHLLNLENNIVNVNKLLALSNPCSHLITENQIMFVDLL